MYLESAHFLGHLCILGLEGQSPSLISKQANEVTWHPVTILESTSRTGDYPSLHCLLGNVFCGQERSKVWLTFAGLHNSGGIVGELANENLALDTVPHQIVLETKCRQCCPRRSQAPVWSLSKPMLVRIGMINITQIVTQLREQPVRNMEVSPSSRITD